MRRSTAVSRSFKYVFFEKIIRRLSTRCSALFTYDFIKCMYERFAGDRGSSEVPGYRDTMSTAAFEQSEPQTSWKDLGSNEQPKEAIGASLSAE